MGVQLPVEIIGRIIAVLYYGQGYNKHSPATLLPLALVSPTFRAEAERLIYCHIHLKSTSQVVKCFTTFLKRPGLAKFTRGLSIQLSLNSTEPLARRSSSPYLQLAKASLMRSWFSMGDAWTGAACRWPYIQEESVPGTRHEAVW